MADKLRFGTGGFPLTGEKRDLAGSVARLRELGLDHLELEFVHNVFMKEDTALKAKEDAERSDISLTVHGSYFVNLASLDRPKWHASVQRVVKAAEIGSIAGARSITFHSGFFQGQDPKIVKNTVKDGIKEIFRQLEEKHVKVKIAPELTGKPSQFGNIEELVSMIKELKDEGYLDASLCIDFAHHYARTGGRLHGYDETMRVLNLVGGQLGEKYLKDLHIHMSAIEYGDKGEKNHLLFLPNYEAYVEAGIEIEEFRDILQDLKESRLVENRFLWRETLQALKAMDVKGYVVCESPVLELDALVLQKYYGGLS
jgi:deoxyribonuclease-4